MIVNYTSSGMNKLRALLNDDARVIIYDCHMFIVKAGWFRWMMVNIGKLLQGLTRCFEGC